MPPPFDVGLSPDCPKPGTGRVQQNPVKKSGRFRSKRKEIFSEFQRIVDETVPSIIAYSAAHVNGVRKEVEGFKSTPMQWLELKEVTLKR